MQIPISKPMGLDAEFFPSKKSRFQQKGKKHLMYTWFSAFQCGQETMEHPGASLNVSIFHFTAFTDFIHLLQFPEDLHPGERILQISFGSGFKCNSAVSCSMLFCCFLLQPHRARVMSFWLTFEGGVFGVFGGGRLEDICACCVSCSSMVLICASCKAYLEILGRLSELFFHLTNDID